MFGDAPTGPGLSSRAPSVRFWGLFKISGDRMLKQIHVRSTAERDDGTPLYPGTWVETWVLMPGAGVWMLLDWRPAPEVEVAALVARATAAG
jgi:hypothetical protein